MLNVFYTDVLGFYILMLNIYAYVLLFFFFFFLIFSVEIQFFSTFNSIVLFKNLNLFYISFLFLFLSLAGIPPFLGFITKFVLVNKLLKSMHFFLFFLLVSFNFFVIYFYIQNFKFLSGLSVFFYLNLKIFNYSLNRSYYFFIVLINFLNLFSFFFFNDFFYFFLSLTI